LAGALLPLGGPKGSGLAFAITLLGGLLAGAEFDDEVVSIYAGGSRRQNLGQLFLVIDPWCVEERGRALRRVRGLVERLHALPAAPGLDGARYAGEGAAERARRRASGGVPVERADLEALAGACRECGLGELAGEIERLLRNC
jgi:LDH2 family malate/lactate/ureidoglycolate dehydrogenase